MRYTCLAPVGEPGIAGNHRLPIPSLGQITFRSTPEFAGQSVISRGGLSDCVAANLLALHESADVEPVDDLAGKDHGLRGSGLKLERELSGRPPVFLAIQPSFPFDGKLEVPIPFRFMAIPP
mgnify:FL=1